MTGDRVGLLGAETQPVDTGAASNDVSVRDPEMGSLQRWRDDRHRGRHAGRSPHGLCVSIPESGWRDTRPVPGRAVHVRPRPGQEVTAGHYCARPGITAGRHHAAISTSPHDPRGWTALEGAAAAGLRSHDDGDPRDRCRDAIQWCACCLPGRGHPMWLSYGRR